MVGPRPGRLGISWAMLGSALVRRLCWGRVWPVWDHAWALWDYAKPMLLSSAGSIIVVSFTVSAMLVAYPRMLGHSRGSSAMLGPCLLSALPLRPCWRCAWSCWGHAGLCWRQVGSYLYRLSDILNT
jgi:hypothetical protein